jgi:acyl-CoA hydrolase
MLVDGFLALRRAGILRRRAAGPDGTRPALVHAGFFVGNRAFYQELRDTAAAGDIAMTAISFTNTLHGTEADKRAHRPHARFVNSAMTATLLGAASSDALADGRVVSGVGGQHDLVAMAHALDGARSIIAVRSTRQARRTTSNIVWSYANTTLPRQLRDIVVTEYGIADLRGASDRDCIARMLTVADAAFQPGLQADAQLSGKLEGSFSLPAYAHGNSAARIQEALGPARHEGLLPRFPLGSEMTQVEQNLTGPLAALRAAGPLDLLRALLAGATGAPDAAERAALDRLSLQAPERLQDRALRALVLGALRQAW